MAETGKGLAGVVVADTRMSKVDGENGKLYYAGYNINDLAENATFEEVIYLLWNNALPTQAQLDEFKKSVSAEMAIPNEVISSLKNLPKEAHPMGALRTGVSMIGAFDSEAEDNSVEANKRKALRLLAKTTTLTAAWARIREGNEPIAPRDGSSIAENFVYMMTGKEPDETSVKAIDVYLILLADHGFNASTFTSRVVTSTDGDIYSAITAAIGALKGPKHGGANEAAMRMFMDEIGEVDKVDDFFTQRVKGEGFKIMGIGHRVYKAPDPRATVLKAHAHALAESTGNDKWFQIAEKLETLALADDYFKERRLFANVDYYSAIVLYTLNIPVDFFTPLFAMSRMAGWTAHVIEQWADNRLIRPKANYVGEIDTPWVAIADR